LRCKTFGVGSINQKEQSMEQTLNS
jgi:hypothetical protein